MSIHYKEIEEEALKEIESISSSDALEVFRVRYLGRSGVVAGLISKIPSLPVEERPAAGKELNSLKSRLKSLIEVNRTALDAGTSWQKHDAIDITLPGISQNIGTAHPLTQLMDEICSIFVSLGFRLFEGPRGVL